MKKRVGKLWRKAGRSNAEADAKIQHSRALHEYNKAVNTAKNASWRKKCEEIEKTEESARLHKFLSKDPSKSIGSLKRPDGSHTDSIKESLCLLLEKHFPGSTIVNNEEGDSTSHFTRLPESELAIVGNIVTADRIRWAIGTFKPFKSPGEDEIFPALLQQGVEEILPSLKRLFRASLSMGIIPEPWRGVKVIFIPKPGKATYSDPKSFRPISLMSFVLKTLEKLVDNT